MISLSEIVSFSVSISVAFALFLFLICIFVAVTKSMAFALVAWTNIVFIVDAMDNYGTLVAHLHITVKAVKYMRDISLMQLI